MTFNIIAHAAPRFGLLLGALMLSGFSMAGPQLSAGVWWVYQDASEGDGDGDFADPAFIAYADDDGSHGPWGFSAEFRVGTGAFTNPESNDSGDNFAMHKAWISYQVDDQSKLFIGKSQVPFGWKTSNFWPGDMLLGGYGDQMDVGFKYSGEVDWIKYDAAFYTQDDWGTSSTDTVDDNGHWGSAEAGVETYRKGKTLVLNADFLVADGHTLGVSVQGGDLEDQVSSDKGDHRAVDLHYYFTHNNFNLKYRLTQAERDLTDLERCQAAALCPNVEVETQRQAVHLDYSSGKWLFYFEATAASTDTKGNNADTVKAYAPGISYNYGPGWLYLEYLSQDGFIDQFGDVGEGDFDSLYVSFDFYF